MTYYIVLILRKKSLVVKGGGTWPRVALTDVDGIVRKWTDKAEAEKVSAMFQGSEVMEVRT